jgi:hypothetical protein
LFRTPESASQDRKGDRKPPVRLTQLPAGVMLAAVGLRDKFVRILIKKTTVERGTASEHS